MKRCNGVTPVTGVTGVTRVTRVTGVTAKSDFPADLDLPPETAAEEPELRQRVWRLAGARGYPRLTLANGWGIAAGEASWRGTCSTWAAPHLADALAQLSLLETNNP